MPADLLHELEAAAPAPEAVREQLDNIESLLQQVNQRIRWAMEHCKGSTMLFEKTWQQLVAAVAEGRTAEVQQARERFLKAVEDRIRLLKHTQDRASLLRDWGMSGLPAPAVLAPELAGMEQLRSRVCDRWQTAEDLEHLAARDYPLTTAELDRSGPQHQPPAAWYAEEGKPF